MEAVFHMEKESKKYLCTFDEKRVDFIMRELSDCTAQELKTLLHMLHEEISTFELSA